MHTTDVHACMDTTSCIIALVLTHSERLPLVPTCTPNLNIYRYLAECPDAHHNDVLRLLPHLLAARPSTPTIPPPPEGALFLAPLLLQRADEQAVRDAVLSSQACVQSLRGALERRAGHGDDGVQGEVEMLQAVMQALQLV